MSEIKSIELTRRDDAERIAYLQDQIAALIDRATKAETDAAEARRETNEAENIANEQREAVRYWLDLFEGYLPQTAIDRLRAILAIPSDQ